MGATKGSGRDWRITVTDMEMTCGGARKSCEPGSWMRPARASEPDGYLLGS